MEGPGQVGTPGPRPGSAAAPRHGPGEALGVPDPADPLLCVPQEAYEEGMRRSLDPEGYEDSGLKSSHLSLGEMSSEWLLGCWGHWQHGHHTGSIAWAPVSQGCQRCTGVAEHGYRRVTWAPVWQR